MEDNVNLKGVLNNLEGSTRFAAVVDALQEAIENKPKLPEYLVEAVNNLGYYDLNALKVKAFLLTHFSIPPTEKEKQIKILEEVDTGDFEKNVELKKLAKQLEAEERKNKTFLFYINGSPVRTKINVVTYSQIVASAGVDIIKYPDSVAVKVAKINGTPLSSYGKLYPGESVWLAPEMHFEITSV